MPSGGNNGGVYNLEIGATLNTSNLEQELKDKKAQLEKSNSTKIKWKFDTGNFTTAIKEINQFNSALGKLKQVKIYDAQSGNILKNDLVKINEGLQTVNTETNKWSNSLGQLVTQVRTVDNEGNTLITETTKYTTALGQQVEEVRLLDENLNQLGNTTTKVSNLIAETTTSTSSKFGQITDTINGVTQSYNGLITTTRTVSSNGETLIKVVSEYTNAAGQAVKKTEYLNERGIHVATTQRQITEATNKASAANKNFSNSTNQAAKSANTLNWSLSDAFRRLANFYLASLPIRAFQTAITDAVQVVKDFDSAITEMGKVSDYSGEKLKSYTRNLADLGTEVARTQTEMTEAATGWLKAGYSEEDAALLSKFSALLQNTADEELSAADATSILVSQLKAYHIEAEDAIKVTDIINKVSANQAVSSGDIAKGLTVASAAMSTFGNSIEETTALLTAGTTIFQGRSQQVARGLNMIATRVAKNEEELAKYGVSINDASGQLRSTYDILVDLAPAWERMSKAEQVSLGNTLAGTNQYKILAAIMSQMDVAVEAYDQALNSSGETEKQNAVYMESLEAKTTALKAEFEKLVISKGGLQDFAKSLIESGTSVLKFIDTIGGLPTLLRVIITLLITINAVKIVNWLGNVYNGVINLSYSLQSAVSAWKSYAAGVVSANTAIEASIPIIGLIATTISVLIGVISNHNRKIEEQTQKIKENIAAFSEEYKALDEAQEKLKNEEITREELNSIIESNFDEYEAERLKLLDINDARKEVIDLIEEEKKARAQELVDTGLSAYEEALDHIENGYDEFDKFFYERRERYSKGILEKAGIADAKTGKEQIDSLKKFRELLIEARKEALKKSGGEKTLGIKNLEKEIKTTEGLISTLTEAQNENIKTQKNYDDALDVTGQHYNHYTQEVVEGSKKSAVAIEEERKGKEKLKQSNKKTIQELDELKKKYEITEDAIYDYMEAHAEENATYDDAVQALALEAEAQSDVVKSTEILNKEYEDTLKSTSALVSSLSDLSSAFEEQEKNGSLSLSTQSKLIESGYALALVYDEETDTCKLDEEAVKKLVEAKIEMQLANLAIARSDIIAQLQAEGQAAVTAAGEFLALAKAKNLANQASVEHNTFDPSKSYAGYGGNYGYLKNDTTQIDALNGEIEALDKLLQDVQKNGRDAFKSISSGAKSAKGSANDANKALEETKKKYETVIKWITKQYDKEINAIKKAKDEAIKAEEEKIKAKEKEKDSLVKPIEEEIKALEKEKKVLDKQKDALNERKEAINDAKSAIIESIEAEIDALEEERDLILDNIEKQIDALEELKEQRQDYWDKQIDALKKANEKLKENLELQEKLDALERAKNTKVKIYKEGKGFVYDVDQTEVNKAQKALDEYLSQKAYEDELARLESLKKAELDNYTERLKELNKYKDNTKKSYNDQIDALKKYKEQEQKLYEEQIKVIEKDIKELDKHIDALNNHKEELDEHKEAIEEDYDAEIEKLNEHKDAISDAYDAEIETWENYKQQFEDMVNAYEEQQNKLLFQQLTGITDESNNWMTRLDNLAEFVRKYNELQKQLDTGNTDVSNTANMSSGGKNGGMSNNYDGSNTRTVTNYSKPNGSTNYTPTYNTNYRASGVQSALSHQGYHGMPTNVKKYANGIDSIRDDEIAIVGENPNREVVIGSKINNGDIMALDKGTGVVNAESTNTLAGMLNQVGKFGSSGFGSGNGVLNNNINNDSLTINGVTIEGSNINDPETFVNGLLNLKAEALQRAYRRS